MRRCSQQTLKIPEEKNKQFFVHLLLGCNCKSGGGHQGAMALLGVSCGRSLDQADLLLGSYVLTFSSGFTAVSDGETTGSVKSTGRKSFGWTQTSRCDVTSTREQS